VNVDELVERVREAIRTGTVDGRRLEGCAFGPCSSSRSRGGAGCYLCDTIARLEQPIALGRALTDAAAVDADVHDREHRNAARDGDPKLSGAKERRHPMYEKRRRQGPHRSNA
jgi:hypothetical protein